MNLEARESFLPGKTCCIILGIFAGLIPRMHREFWLGRVFGHD